MRTYTVIGTGAVGGYYGGKLAHSGQTVRFLARSDFEHIRTSGLKIESPRGDFHLKDAEVYSRPEDLPPSDVILISLKTTSNGKLRNLLTPLVHPGTVLLVLQNGLGMEEEIQSWFSDSIVMGGMCFICSRKEGPGHIRHMDYGLITLGCLESAHLALRDAIGKEMEAADIPVTPADDLKEARWRKLLWNIPYNGLSVILNSRTDRIMNTPSSRRIIRMLMKEVVRGAAACGVTIEEEAIDRMMSFTDRMIPYEPSMKLDFEACRPMELEYMYRRPLEKSAEHGFDMKAVALLTEQLTFLEETRNA